MSRPQDVINTIINQNRQAVSPTGYPPPNMIPGGPGDVSGGQMPISPRVLPQTGVNAPEMRTMRPPSMALPRDPDSRLDIWRGLLTDFMFSLGSGLAARARNPRAGIGEAFLAPFELEQREQEMALRRRTEELRAAQEERTRAASADLMARIAENQTKLPIELEQLLARNRLTGAQTDLAEARTEQVENPALRPGVERISGQMLTVEDARTLQRVAGRKFYDRSGNEIQLAGLQPQMGLVLVSGGTPGQPRYEVVTQPTRTLTMDNITSLIPTRTPASPLAQGVAQPPSTTSGFSTTQNIDPATGEVVLQQLPTGSTTIRQTGPTSVPGVGAPGPVQPSQPPQQRVAPPAPTPQQPTQPTQSGLPPFLQPRPQAVPPSTRGLPPAELQRQRQFAVPIRAAAVQLFGDPTRPDFQSLASFANLADDPAARRRIGAAARLIINDLAGAERRGGDVGGLLGDIAHVPFIGELLQMVRNNSGLPVDLAESQANAVEIALGQMRPEEVALLNRIMVAYGTVVGLRSLTRAGAYKFSTDSMQRELPIPGIADVNSATSYYNKLAALAEEIVTGIEGSGISRAVLPQQDFYREAADALIQLGRGTPSTQRPLTDFVIRGGRVVPRTPTTPPR